MELYVREIQATPLLSAAEERELAYRVRAGDAEARARMVRANLRLVVSIARLYSHTKLSLSDLVAEGNLGLLRAVEAFDPARNVRFGTYATYWIKQSIRRAVMNTGRLIRLPIYIQVLVSEWTEMTTRLRAELGRAPADEEIARRMRLSRKKLASIKKAIHSQQTAAYVACPPDQTPIHERIIDRKAPAPAECLGQQEEVDALLHQVNQLSPREALVLRLRFGLDGEEPQRLAQIGDRLGLTRARVGQIEQAALRKLRHKMTIAHTGARTAARAEVALLCN
jgi:RNA polymerase primary sigma factor